MPMQAVGTYGPSPGALAEYREPGLTPVMEKSELGSLPTSAVAVPGQYKLT